MRAGMSCMKDIGTLDLVTSPPTQQILNLCQGRVSQKQIVWGEAREHLQRLWDYIWSLDPLLATISTMTTHKPMSALIKEAILLACSRALSKLGEYEHILPYLHHAASFQAPRTNIELSLRPANNLVCRWSLRKSHQNCRSIESPELLKFAQVD